MVFTKMFRKFVGEWDVKYDFCAYIRTFFEENLQHLAPYYQITQKYAD